VGENKDIGNNPMSVSGEAEGVQGRGLVQGAKNAWNTAIGNGGLNAPKGTNSDADSGSKSQEER
jgi:hypothetical protein